GQVDGAGNLGFQFAIDLRARRGVHLVAERLHRVARLPAARLLALAKAESEVLARADVLEPAVGHALDEGRAGAFAHRANEAAGGAGQRKHVVLLDARSGPAVRAR